MFNNLYLAFLSAFLASFLITPLVIIFAKKYELTDDAKKRAHPANTHQGIIPRAGGAGIFLTISLVTFFFIPINKIIFFTLIGALFLTVIGILDDKYDIPPSIRLIINLASAIIVVASGIGIPYFKLPFVGIIDLDKTFFTLSFMGKSLWWFADLLAIVWLAAMMNFINWSKGVDGQLPGFVSVSSFFLGILAMRFSAHDISKESVATLSFIVSGAFLGFLPFNFYPQKIMPGYSGGTLAGFFLGVISLLSWGKVGTLAMCLAIPLTDAGYTIIRRISKGQSPLKGDSFHLHHRLLSIGWGKRRISIFYILLSFIYGLVALYFSGSQKIIALFITILLLGMFFYLIDHIRQNHPKK